MSGQYSTEDIFSGARGTFDEMFGGAGNFESIFEQLLGGGRGRGGRGFGAWQGRDLLYETSVTLEEVLHGKQLDIELNKIMACEECRGSGCHPGTGRKVCGSCSGRGQISKARRMGGFGSFVTTMPCSQCNARGWEAERPCDECKGKGSRRGRKRIAFRVPPGVVDGDYTIEGEGDEVPEGRNGNLIIRVRVRQHDTFSRDGRDIHMTIPISMVDLALGCVVDVPTLDGKQTIKISPGTQPEYIKLRGKGVPHIHQRGKGSMYVHLVAQIPKKLSKTQKRLLEEFKRSDG